MEFYNLLVVPDGLRGSDDRARYFQKAAADFVNVQQ